MMNTNKIEILNKTSEEVKREQLVLSLVNIIKSYAEMKQTSNNDMKNN